MISNQNYDNPESKRQKSNHLNILLNEDLSFRISFIFFLRSLEVTP